MAIANVFSAMIKSLVDSKGILRRFQATLPKSEGIINERLRYANLEEIGFSFFNMYCIENQSVTKAYFWASLIIFVIRQLCITQTFMLFILYAFIIIMLQPCLLIYYMPSAEQLKGSAVLIYMVYVGMYIQCICTGINDNPLKPLSTLSTKQKYLGFTKQLYVIFKNTSLCLIAITKLALSSSCKRE